MQDPALHVMPLPHVCLKQSHVEWASPLHNNFMVPAVQKNVMELKLVGPTSHLSPIWCHTLPTTGELQCRALHNQTSPEMVLDEDPDIVPNKSRIVTVLDGTSVISKKKKNNTLQAPTHEPGVRSAAATAFVALRPDAGLHVWPCCQMSAKML